MPNSQISLAGNEGQASSPAPQGLAGMIPRRKISDRVSLYEKLNEQSKKQARPPLPRRKAAIRLQSWYRMVRQKRRYQDIKKQHHYRQQVIDEIHKSERAYLGQLDQVIQIFLIPLRASAASQDPIIGADDVRTIFSTIEIIVATNRELLNEIEKRMEGWFPSQLIGDIFVKMAAFMKVYTNYVKNFNNALAKIQECKNNPRFVEFCDAGFKAMGGDTIDLPSFLITPVQRIPRYQLLLKDLFKHTWPEHPDYENIETALRNITETAQYVNTKQREAENIQKVLHIQSMLHGKNLENLVDSHRRFVREGSLMEVNSKGRPKARYFFLFNDILVKCKSSASQAGLKKRSLQKKSKDSTLTGLNSITGVFEYLGKMYLATADVINLADDENRKHGFEVISPDTSMWLCASSEEEKKSWVQSINDEIKLLKKQHEFYDEQATKIAAQKAAQAKALIAEQYAGYRVHGSYNSRHSLQRGIDSAQRRNSMSCNSDTSSVSNYSTNNDNNNNDSDDEATYNDDLRDEEVEKEMNDFMGHHRHRNSSGSFAALSPIERMEMQKRAEESLSNLLEEEQRMQASAQSKARDFKELVHAKYGSLESPLNGHHHSPHPHPNHNEWVRMSLQEDISPSKMRETLEREAALTSNNNNNNSAHEGKSKSKNKKRWSSVQRARNSASFVESVAEKFGHHLHIRANAASTPSPAASALPPPPAGAADENSPATTVPSTPAGAVDSPGGSGRRRFASMKRESYKQFASPQKLAEAQMAEGILPSAGTGDSEQATVPTGASTPTSTDTPAGENGSNDNPSKTNQKGPKRGNFRLAKDRGATLDISDLPRHRRQAAAEIEAASAAMAAGASPGIRRFAVMRDDYRRRSGSGVEAVTGGNAPSLDSELAAEGDALQQQQQSNPSNNAEGGTGQRKFASLKREDYRRASTSCVPSPHHAAAAASGSATPVPERDSVDTNESTQPQQAPPAQPPPQQQPTWPSPLDSPKRQKKEKKGSIKSKKKGGGAAKEASKYALRKDRGATLDIADMAASRRATADAIDNAGVAGQPAQATATATATTAEQRQPQQGGDAAAVPRRRFASIKREDFREVARARAAAQNSGGSPPPEESPAGRDDGGEGAAETPPAAVGVRRFASMKREDFRQRAHSASSNSDGPSNDNGAAQPSASDDSSPSSDKKKKKKGFRGSISKMSKKKESGKE